MIDLSPQHLAELVSILRIYVPNCEIRAFGSRVNRKAVRYSDLDLAIYSDHAIDQNTIWQLEEAFSDSDLPFMVDVLDWHCLSDQFKEIINQNYDVISLSRR